MALTDWVTAYRKLDESSGNAVDSVWTNTGVNTWTVSYATGKINNACSIDNTRRYFNCWSTGELNTTQMSISARINTSKTTQQYILTCSGNNTADRWYLWTWITSNKFNVYFQWKSSAWWHVSNTSVCDWNRHHIVATCSTTQILLYVDWALDKTIASTNNITTGTQEVHIWDRHRTSSPFYPPFSWLIDEIGVWNRAITWAEVTELYNWWSWLSYPFSAPTADSNFFIFF